MPSCCLSVPFFCSTLELKRNSELTPFDLLGLYFFEIEESIFHAISSRTGMKKFSFLYNNDD